VEALEWPHRIECQYTVRQPRSQCETRTTYVRRRISSAAVTRNLPLRCNNSGLHIAYLMSRIWGNKVGRDIVSGRKVPHCTVQLCADFEGDRGGTGYFFVFIQMRAQVRETVLLGYSEQFFLKLRQ
jgi:hypothetical protein